jgi:hypothetical protein
MMEEIIKNVTADECNPDRVTAGAGYSYCCSYTHA